jgi:hypothetical protein
MVRTVDGKPRPFGEDRPKKLKAGSLVLALGLGVALASVGTAGGVGGGAAAIGTSASEGVSVSVRTARTSQQKAERTRVRLSLRNSNVRVTGEAADQDCAAYATGRVRVFLVEHPCRSLQRVAQPCWAGGGGGGVGGDARRRTGGAAQTHLGRAGLRHDRPFGPSGHAHRTALRVEHRWEPGDHRRGGAGGGWGS